MGNAASKEESPTHGGPSQGGSPQDSKSAAAKDEQQPRKPRRRESIQVLSTARASALPPAASLDTAQGQSSSHSSTGSRAAHSRGRSQTSATPASRPILDAASQAQTTAKQSSLPSHPMTTNHDTPPQAIPVRTNSPAVATAPTPTTVSAAIPDDELDDASMSSPSGNAYQASHYNRPPRLPLPIQEEVFSPGSPIISPADITGEAVLGDDAFPRNPSMLSSTTVDEDEQGELGEEFRDPQNKETPAIDTKITWRGGGENVYITGSFSRWNKKWRMHRIAEGSDVFERTLPLPPGIHHLTFVVDGDMRRSNELPTAVDYTNYLVNYIDVHMDTIPEDTTQLDTSHQVTPQPTPALEKDLTLEAPPQSPTIDAKPQSIDPATAPSSTGLAPDPTARPEVARRREDRAYHSEIPRFLADLDEPEESSAFHRASSVLGTQPAPPSLPMFLNKSILNGATPMKDDASVLIMPNHTVLNHLATSSIKSNVLATSGTTRYKRKYVTTIMYKPTNDHGE